MAKKASIKKPAVKKKPVKKVNKPSLSKKIGKPKYIESPEKMWEYFTAYRTEIKSKPLKQHDFVGGFATEVEKKKERPLTMEGFQNWLDDNDIITDVTDYFENKQDRYKDYVRVCSRVRRNIRADQIEGGMAGIYNPSITQRLNNLVEKQQTEIISEQPLFPEQ